MGIFSKKPPCAICGGKVEFFLPMKIEGEYVCSDCAEKIDMPDDRRSALTMAELREYLSYYEENRNLANQFTLSWQVDMNPSYGDSVFDYEHRLFCLDADLKKLVFEGRCVKNFVIREDQKTIFEGNSQGVRCIDSGTVATVQAMIPKAALVQMARHIEEEHRRQEREDGDDACTTSTGYRNHFSFQEPFKNFYVDIYMEHPYYPMISFKKSAPIIIDSDPDLDGYLREYNDTYERLRHFAEGLMNVAFPGTGFIGAAGTSEGTVGVSENPVDAVEEIKKYKELLDAGIITQEEFDSKKKQLMGI